MSWESIVVLVQNFVTALLSWIPKIKNICKNKNIPSTTIVIADNNMGYQNYWSIGTGHAGKQILQVSCSFMVTNITNRPVALAKAVLKGLKGQQDLAILHVKDINSRYFGSYDIPPMTQTIASIDYIIHPKKMPKKGQKLKLTVGIIDQFGNKHWIKNIISRPAH